MFRKKFALMLLAMAVLFTVSAVSAGDMNQTDIDNDLLENTQQDMKVQSDSNVWEISSQNDEALEAGNMEDEILAAQSKDVLKSSSSPTHVNLEVSHKTVTYGRLQHIAVKVTGDDGKPVEDVRVTFKIYKSGKLVDTLDGFVSGSDGYLYYYTQKLNAGTYTVKYEVVHKNLYSASVATSKLTVKKVKLSIKVKRETGGLNIFVKKNKKPINNIKLKVKIYTGKKYKTIYLKSGSSKGVCAFVTNVLKVGKHKVVITVVNKNYRASKTSSFKVTKSIKKKSPILVLLTGGKIEFYRGF